MNIVAAMKQIPDLQQIRIRERTPILDDVPWILGSIDKNALEAAVRIKESIDGKVTVLSGGNPIIEDTIKEALAAGADEAFLVVEDKFDSLDSSVVSGVLAASIKKLDDIGLILFGEGSGDNYSGQVGSRVAQLLNLPQVGYAKSIELNGSTARITRSLEDGDEIIEVELPAVIMVTSGINEPRIPSVTQILKAGKKPKTITNISELGLPREGDNLIATINNLAPKTQRKGIILKNADELLQALKNQNLVGR